MSFIPIGISSNTTYQIMERQNRRMLIVQSGDGIDIAFLPRGYYLLFIQMGDCVQGRLFIARGTYPSDVGVVLEEQTHSVAKILCGGQIYILRGDKTYTMQGMEVQ